MKVLMTGGSGFIGTHLIKHLLNRIDHIEIVSLDIQSSEISDTRVLHRTIDIRRTELLLESFDNESFDMCIHLAALCKEPGFEWNEYFDTNFQATKNVLALCEKLEIKKIIFTSTMMVYLAEDMKKDEEDLTAPNTAYGISKLLAEKEIECWRSSESGHSMKIIRPAVVFGKNENGNFTRLYKSLKSRFFPYVGKKSIVKSNVYVLELVEFIDFLIFNETKHEIFNFAFPDEYRMDKIIQDFKDVFDLKPLTPVIPFKVLLFVSYFFEFLNSIGIRNSIHHRRIEKLYYSTYIFPKNAIAEGYVFGYNLKSALNDWKEECGNNSIF